MTGHIPSPISFLGLLFRGTVVILSDILRIVHSSLTIFFVTQKSHFSLRLLIPETFIDNVVLFRGSSFVVVLMLLTNNEDRYLNVIGEVHSIRRLNESQMDCDIQNAILFLGFSDD
jgi:hypothetical protein